MRKFVIYAISAMIFGAIASLAYGSEFEKTHPPLNLSAFSAETPKADAKNCDCVHGEKCTCGEDCTCAEGIGCGKRAARRAARQQDSGVEDATYSVGVVQPTQGVIATEQTEPVQVASNRCPCCGMVMNAEQTSRMKTKLAAPVQAVPIQAAPVQAAPVWQTSYAMPMYGSGVMQGGSCSGGNCAGGNCGTGRAGLFRRR